MTTQGTPIGTPGSGGGGMPKWLIVLLVVLVVVLIGCCGGVSTCFFLARWAAQNMGPALQQMQDEMIKQAKAAQTRAQGQNPGVAVPPAADNAGNAGTPGAPGAAGVPNAPAPAAVGPTQKLPSNFPTDVPVQEGLTSTFSIGDNTKGSGSVMLSGNVKPDDAVAYYTKTLEKNGWTQTGNTTMNELTQLQYTKDTRKLVVQVSGGTGGAATNVMLIYEKQ